ncbi:hypothetical protein CR513_43000, partial [Mucuna pruriens]
MQISEDKILPNSLPNSHTSFLVKHTPCFHVSQLRKNTKDLLHVLEPNIVIWSDATRDATWELEDKMQEQYPHLFLGKGSLPLCDLVVEIYIG